MNGTAPSGPNMPGMRERAVLFLIVGVEPFGSERATLHVARSLRSAGCKVRCVLEHREDRQNHLGEMVTTLGIDVVFAKMAPHISRTYFLTDRQYRRSLFANLCKGNATIFKEIRSGRWDAVVFNKPSVFPYAILSFLAYGNRMTFRVGDLPPVGSWYQTMEFKLANWLCGQSVAISNFVADSMVKLGVAKGKIEVIHNVPTRSRCTVPSAFPMRRKHQFVFVGQLTEKKGIGVLIEAVLGLNRSDVGLWVVGGSEFGKPYVEGLRQLTEAHENSGIEFIGSVPDPSWYYAHADYHVVPSQYDEPLGNVVQEARECFCPSIVSPKGGLTELVSHLQTGIILSGRELTYVQHGLLEAIKMKSDGRHETIRRNLKDMYFHSECQQEFVSNWLKVIHS